MLRLNKARVVAPAALAALVVLACAPAHGAGSAGRTSTSAAVEPGASRIRTRHAASRPARSADIEPAPAVEPAALVPGAENPVRVRLEVARTPAARQRGLMYRRELADDHGMLFVFQGRPAIRTFWMRDTFVPLDMIFLDEDLRVVGVVQDAEPESDEACEVDTPSLYVLEVPAGFAARHGVALGARIRIEGVDGVDVAEGEGL